MGNHVFHIPYFCQIWLPNGLFFFSDPGLAQAAEPEPVSLRFSDGATHPVSLREVNAMKKVLLISALVAAVAAAQAQSLVLYYNFNDTTSAGAFISPSVNLVNAAISTDLGVPAGAVVGPSAGNFGTFSGSTQNARNGDVAGGSFAFAAGAGFATQAQTITLQYNSTGLTNQVLTQWAQRSNTGFNAVALDYRIGQGSWVNIASGVTVATSPGALITVNLPNAMDNQADVSLRWTISGATNSGGTFRTDNITIDAIPEPMTMSVLALGLAGLAARRRRK